MFTGLGIKTPFDYSVFSAAAAAFILAFREPQIHSGQASESIMKLSG